MKEIKCEELKYNPFDLIGKVQMLVCAEVDGKANAMTASWGMLGVFCGKNVAITVIRPQRYTKEFIDGADTFSLSFMGDDNRENLKYFGTVSGRDEDKIAVSGIEVAHDEKTPYFPDAEAVMICEKMCRVPMKEADFIKKELCEKWFPNSDYHEIYIGEIKKILVK